MLTTLQTSNRKKKKDTHAYETKRWEKSKESDTKKNTKKLTRFTSEFVRQA